MPPIDPRKIDSSLEMQPMLPETDDVSKSAHSRRLNRKIRRQKSEPTSGLRSKSETWEKLKGRLKKAWIKVRPAPSQSYLKNQLAAMQALTAERVFTAEEFSSAAGHPLKARGQLRTLTDMIDRYDSEVASSDSTLSRKEKAIRTLELQVAARKFLATQPKGSIKSSRQARETTESLLRQIDLLLYKHKADFSGSLRQWLCDDIENHGGEHLQSLYERPELLESIVSSLEYHDLLVFIDTHGKHVTLSEPEHISLMTRAIWQVISQLDSHQLLQHRDAYTTEMKLPDTRPMTGDISFDRNQELCAVMGALLSEQIDAVELGMAVYQSYQDGHLTMDMLEGMLQHKNLTMPMALADDSALAEEVYARLDQSALKKMHIGSYLESLSTDRTPKKARFYLYKLNEFDILLKADPSRKDMAYRNFVFCWDDLRNRFMPEYNQRHQKETLVETGGVLSQELAKFTPEMLRQLDKRPVRREAVSHILQQTGWQKSPDHFDFKKALEQAKEIENGNHSKATVEAIKHQAAQDCLFRYCEQRAGITFPSTTW